VNVRVAEPIVSVLETVTEALVLVDTDDVSTSVSVPIVIESEGV
jgi:hypothetical protein